MNHWHVSAVRKEFENEGWWNLQLHRLGILFTWGMEGYSMLRRLMLSMLQNRRLSLTETNVLELLQRFYFCGKMACAFRKTTVLFIRP